MFVLLQREAKRQQKADEAAKKAAETEKKAAETAKKKQATEAAKAGFGSSTELHKAQNVFKVGLVTALCNSSAQCLWHAAWQIVPHAPATCGLHPWQSHVALLVCC